MAGCGRGKVLAAGGAALALLAGCGPSSQPATPQSEPANAATPSSGQGGAPATLALPPAPDPDHDLRPDRAKFDDFAGRLEAIQANLAQVDAAFIGRVRTSLQPGSDAGAKAALADYRVQIAADTAAQPAPPRLAGCFAQAQSLNAKAEAAIAAMLSARRDKAAAVAAVTDRPLTLPDFGGLATDIATGAGADDAKSSLVAARAAVAGCHGTQATPHARSAAAGSTQRAPQAERAVAPTSTAPAPPPAAPPTKKPTLFQRMFGGG